MRDVMQQLLPWWRAGKTAGVATVIATFQSAPRLPGASMLVGPDGEAVGSVSGGCVEGAVYELAEQVVADRTPVLQRYGVSDDDAFAVGLTCGGILDVFVEVVDQESFPELGAVADDIESGRPVAVATVVAHDDPSRLGRRLIIRPEGHADAGQGSIGSSRADDAVAADRGGVGVAVQRVADGAVALAAQLARDPGVGPHLARRDARRHRPHLLVEAHPGDDPARLDLLLVPAGLAHVVTFPSLGDLYDRGARAGKTATGKTFGGWQGLFNSVKTTRFVHTRVGYRG